MFYSECADGARPSERDTPSRSAARCHGLCSGPRRGAAGAVSAKNRSSAATIAAASVSDAGLVSSSIRDVGGRRSPLRAMRPLYPAHRGRRRLISLAVATIPVLDADAVLESVGAAEAIDLTQLAFERHAEGEGRCRPRSTSTRLRTAISARCPRGARASALLKWVTSFPRNAERGLPAVTGALLLSSAETGQMLAIMDCASVTSLRTGAAAALSARVLARRDAASVGVIGCGVNGAWAARCMAAAGYGAGVCADPRAKIAAELAAELGWTVGPRSEAARQDVVVTVTPGAEPVILASDLRPDSISP